MALFSMKKYEEQIKAYVNQFNVALVSIDDKVNKSYLDLKELRKIYDELKEEARMIRACLTFLIVEMTRIQDNLTDEEHERRVNRYVEIMKKHGYGPDQIKTNLNGGNI